MGCQTALRRWALGAEFGPNFGLDNERLTDRGKP
jgi:hypothetical protein